MNNHLARQNEDAIVLFEVNVFACKRAHGHTFVGGRGGAILLPHTCASIMTAGRKQLPLPASAASICDRLRIKLP